MTWTNRVARLTAALLLAAIGLAAGSASAQQAPKRAITQITGDLYRFQNNFHFSVFLVTPAGVIATDPINADAVAWLKAEIAKRFGQPHQVRDLQPRSRRPQLGRRVCSTTRR